MGILAACLLVVESCGGTEGGLFDVLMFEFVHFVLFWMAVFFAAGVALTIRRNSLVWRVEAAAMGHARPAELAGIRRDYFLLSVAFRRDAELLHDVIDDYRHTSRAK
eukprot:gene24688-24766_t